MDANVRIRIVVVTFRAGDAVERPGAHIAVEHASSASTVVPVLAVSAHSNGEGY